MAKVDVQAPSEENADATDAPVQATDETAVTEQSDNRSKNLKPTPRLLVEALLVIAVVALALWSWTLYTDRNNLNDQLNKVNNNPQLAVQKQTNDLIAEVGQLIQLPKNETPTIAAVSDAAKAKEQSAFFANAQNGDKVLMYVKAGEAILYRPSDKKIIIVAPLTFSGDASNTTPANTSTDTSKTTSKN